MIELTIAWYECLQTERRFPNATLVGDTDMATDGYATLTSVAAQEVVVAALTTATESQEQFQLRINKQLGRSDLRYVETLRYEGGVPGRESRVSFQEFLKATKAYPPRRAVVRSIYDHAAEARACSEVSEAQFVSEGGRVTRLNGA